MELSRRQFALALAALLQAPVKQQQAAPTPTERSQRTAAIAALGATLRDELAMSGAGTWDAWTKRLEPVRAQWKQVAAGSLKGRNGYIFNRNALGYLTSSNLEAGLEGTKPLDVFTVFDQKLKKRGIDFLYAPIPSIEEVYPEN